MGLPVMFYDAFVDPRCAVTGNAAGVVTGSHELEGDAMARVAKAVNAPITVFAQPRGAGPEPVFDVRFFGPECEVPLCGHGTVALFAALAAEGAVRARPAGAVARQRTAAGEFNVTLYCDPGGLVVEMEQNRPRFRSVSLDGRAMQQFLGPVPVSERLPVEIAGTGLNHLFVPYDSVDDLAQLAPEPRYLLRLCRALDLDSVSAFALDGSGTAPVRMRNFCTTVGGHEESACGTASGAMACYLVKNGAVHPDSGGRVELVMEMGVEMGRPSRVEARLRAGRNGQIEGVAVRGRAICRLRGEMYIA